MLCANTRALKFRVLHIAVVEPPETSRSSGRMNLTHLTSTSRQDVLKCAGIVSVFVPRLSIVRLSVVASIMLAMPLVGIRMLVITKSGLGSGPAVVFPSVNMTMTLAFVEFGSNSAVAFAKASAWFVKPPAARLSTAAFSSSTEVMSWVSCFRQFLPWYRICAGGRSVRLVRKEKAPAARFYAAGGRKFYEETMGAAFPRLSASAQRRSRRAARAWCRPRAPST